MTPLMPDHPGPDPKFRQRALPTGPLDRLSGWASHNANSQPTGRPVMTFETPRAVAIAGLLALFTTWSVVAQESAATPVEEVEPPPPVRSGETLDDADITIVRTPDETRYEYRVGGKLVGIRVEPVVGITYYLVDTDGDGDMERSSNPYGPGFYVNSWVLFSW